MLSNPLGETTATEQGSGGLKRVLGVPTLVMFGIAYMVPLGVFTTYGIVTEMTEGRLPLAYLLTLSAILVTARNYGKMVKIYPSAGSSYAFATRAFGTPIGFIAGWSTLVDYVLLPMVNYLVIGIYLQAAIPTVPIWVWILSVLVITTGLNLLGIKMVSTANFLLLAVQGVFIVVFCVLAFSGSANEAPEAYLAPFNLDGASLGAIASGAAILCFSFLGFDAISTLSEEAKDARRKVPLAILLAPIIAGIIFILVSYAGHLIFPHWQNFTDVDSAAIDVATAAGGKILSSFFVAAYVAGCIASAMISQASVSRILFAMGRDRLLPRRVFGEVSKRFGTPTFSVLIVGAVSLLALVLTLEFVSSLISFGALVAFTITNIAVIKTYAMDKRHGGPVRPVAHVLLPVLGAALTVWLWTSLSPHAVIVGLSWMTLGLIYILAKTRFFTRKLPSFTSLGLNDQTSELAVVSQQEGGQ